jgi:acetyl esterase/lipase
MIETLHVPGDVGTVSLEPWYVPEDQYSGSRRILRYKEPDDGAALNLHVFAPAGAHPSDALPAVCFFFGGGWRDGTPEHFYPQARYLSQHRGYIAVCAEYRTEASHGTTPFAALEDAKSAMRWLRGHAADIGVDARRLAAGGGSAGGHLAAACALVDGWSSPGDDASVSPRPDLLALFNPVLNNANGNYGEDRLGEYAPRFSPAHNVRPGVPPTIILSGTEDHLVPPQILRAFGRDVDRAGGEIELHLFDGEGHGFFNYRAPEANADRPNWRYDFMTTLQLTANFLDRNL